MRLLMAAPGPPTPSGKGYQVRLYNQILGLANRHAITLLTFKGADETINPDIVTACKRVVAVPWSARSAASAALLHASRLPLSVGLYVNRRMAEAVTSEVEGGGHDLVHLQMVRMALYLRETAGLPSVLDLLDAAELNMRERARAAAPGIRQFLYIEAARLGAYEHQAIARASLSLLISRRDLAFLGDPPSARLLPNGIEPVHLETDPPKREAATVIFTGTMSYFPNSDAAVWFATDIWPHVRAAIPAAVCKIVGRGPTSAVKQLGALPGITVTGAVPQIAAELARATVAVAPVRLGSGMLTKVLEAMAVGTPVVGTSEAFEGLPEDLHRYFHRADSPAAFAGEVIRILKDTGPALKVAGDGLDAIRREHTWSRSVRDLEHLYDEAVSGPLAQSLS